MGVILRGSSGWRMGPRKDPPKPRWLVFSILCSQLIGCRLLGSPEKGPSGALGADAQGQSRGSGWRVQGILSQGVAREEPSQLGHLALFLLSLSASVLTCPCVALSLPPSISLFLVSASDPALALLEVCVKLRMKHCVSSRASRKLGLLSHLC